MSNTGIEVKAGMLQDSYYWYDKDGNRHGPYHNYKSAEHAKRKWEEAGLDD